MTAPVQEASANDDEREDEPSEGQQREAIRRMKIDLALAKSPELSTLESRLYKHVLDCIDFDALNGLEQMLWFAVDKLGHGALDLEASLSHRLIERALIRAALDIENTFTDVPYGITKAEQRAVRFDPDCLFCEYDEQRSDEPEQPGGGHDHEDDPCPLCDDMVREWRARHADQLRAASERRAARRQKSQRPSRKGWR